MSDVGDDPRLAAILPIQSDRQRGPWCVARIHVSEVPYTGVQRRRVEMTKAKGIDRDQCGQPANYLFDGVLVCRRHAGDIALDILLDNPRVRPRQRDWIMV